MNEYVVYLKTLVPAAYVIYGSAPVTGGGHVTVPVAAKYYDASATDGWVTFWDADGRPAARFRTDVVAYVVLVKASPAEAK